MIFDAMVQQGTFFIENLPSCFNYGLEPIATPGRIKYITILADWYMDHFSRNMYKLPLNELSIGIHNMLQFAVIVTGWEDELQVTLGSRSLDRIIFYSSSIQEAYTVRANNSSRIFTAEHMKIFHMAFSVPKP